MTPTYLILNSPTGDLAQYGERNSSHGAAISAIACRVGRAETHMERNVKKLLITSAALITALCTLAFVAFATPASAGEYCRRDVTSYMLSCSFDNMEQCHEMSSGRGGDCFRDPLLPDVSSAYAYAPKALGSKPGTHRTKTPIKNQ